MGKGGGGGSPAPAPAQQVVSKTEIPEWFKPYLTEVFERARTASEEAYQAPPEKARLQEIGKETIADIDPAQQAALDSLASADTAKVGLAAIGEGQDLTRTAGTAITGDEITQAMNPFQQAVTDIAIREEQRRAATQRQQIQAQAARSGAFGGSRGALMEAEFERNLGQRLADIQTSGSAAAFDRATQRLMQERQRQLAAGQQMAGLGTTEQAATYSGLRTQLGAGEARRGLEQEQISRGLEEFQREADYPARQVGFYSGIIRGYQPPMNTYQSTMTPYSPTQAMLGTATAAGALGKGFGLFNDGGIVSLAFGGAPSQQYTESVGDEEGISSMVGQPVASYAPGGNVELTDNEIQQILLNPALLSSMPKAVRDAYERAQAAEEKKPFVDDTEDETEKNDSSFIQKIGSALSSDDKPVNLEMTDKQLERADITREVYDSLNDAQKAEFAKRFPPITGDPSLVSRWFTGIGDYFDRGPAKFLAANTKEDGSRHIAGGVTDDLKFIASAFKPGSEGKKIREDIAKAKKEAKRIVSATAKPKAAKAAKEDLSWLDPEKMYEGVDDFSYGPGKASDLIKKTDAVEKETDKKESKEKTDLTDWFGLAAAGLALSGGRESDRALAAKLLSGIKRPEDRALAMMKAKYYGALPEVENLKSARSYKAKTADLQLKSRKLLSEMLDKNRKFGLEIFNAFPEHLKMLSTNDPEAIAALSDSESTEEQRATARAKLASIVQQLASSASGLAEGGAVPENLQKYGVTSIRNI